MTLTLSLTPRHTLKLTDQAVNQPQLLVEHATELATAVQHSTGRALLLLAAEGLNWPVPPELDFWRGFARKFLEKLCLFGNHWGAEWENLPPLSPSESQEFLSTAPPLPGGEYLTEAALLSMWRDLHQEILARSKVFTGGPEAFLQTLNPLWHALGRLTFHLAENPQDPERPFAFMATYTERLSSQAKLQHRPLADAVRQFASARDQPKLSQLLEPVRRAAEQSKLAAELLATKAIFQAQAWNINQAHRFLVEAPVLQSAGIVLRLPNWWRARQAPRPVVDVRIGERRGDTTTSALLDFQVGVSLDGEPLTEEEREQIWQSAEKMLFLRGKWVEVDREKLQQAVQQWKDLRQERAAGLNLFEGMRLLAGLPRMPGKEEELPAADWSRVTAGSWLQETLTKLRDPATVQNCQPGKKLQATLRPYQAEGVRWLWFLHSLGLGACLADDMGLGKTIQIIDLLQQLTECDQTRLPSLLVVPASLVGNWKQEFAKFAPNLRIFLAHRSECDQAGWEKFLKAPEATLKGYDAVVTTYTQVRGGDWASKLDWRLLVLDEAQAIKNPRSAQTKAVKQLSAQARVVLTGTPIENHLGDLWSLFDFLNPGLLGTASDFKKFAKQSSQQAAGSSLGSLRRLVRPYILRRLKTDPRIAAELPEKTEVHAECGLSKRQAVLYERAIITLAEKLRQTEGIKRRGLILAVLMQLKQICNHPAQYLGESEYVPRDSGKFTRLAELCETIAARQERVLVFTQFQAMTGHLAEYMQSLFGEAGLVLDGSTPVALRQKLVKQFQAENGPPFFVISLKAGGSGLNLTAASQVIHFDRWWNPAVENQATDRAFRLGQKRNVLVHKFVCRGTLEERIDDLLRSKQTLADEILAEQEGKLLTEMKDEELLRFVALDLHRAEDT
ncbi:MAG: DEAD/DEAH box helicase [Pirellulales bacterium]|nr:DEAD/DEAH box helicase [Pirellulales bacterium]